MHTLFLVLFILACIGGFVALLLLMGGIIEESKALMISSAITALVSLAVILGTINGSSALKEHELDSAADEIIKAEQELYLSQGKYSTNSLDLFIVDQQAGETYEELEKDGANIELIRSKLSDGALQVKITGENMLGSHVTGVASYSER